MFLAIEIMKMLGYSAVSNHVCVTGGQPDDQERIQNIQALGRLHHQGNSKVSPAPTSQAAG